MLIDFGDLLINTSHVVSAKSVSDAGGSRTLATLITGETITVPENGIFFLEGVCGMIVPAPAGLLLIEAFIPTRERPGPKINIWETAVVAFRVVGGIQSPIPIGLRGEPSTEAGAEHAVIQADGRCVGVEHIWQDRDAFVAYCEEKAAPYRQPVKEGAPPSEEPPPQPTRPTLVTTPPAKPEPLTELRARILAEPIQAVAPDAPWRRPGMDFVAAIKAVRTAHPDLHGSGVGYDRAWGWKWKPGQLEKERAEMTSPGHVEEFERAIRFLSHVGPHVQRNVNRKRSSYSWKHVAERVMGAYVSNGMLIAAAYALGYTVATSPDSPNPYLNLSEKAAALDPDGVNGT